MKCNGKGMMTAMALLVWAIAAESSLAAIPLARTAEVESTPPRRIEGDRIIVRQRIAGTRSHDKAAVVRAAVARARLLDTPPRQRGNGGMLGVRMLHPLASGGDAFSLSRALSQAEMARLLAELRSDPGVLLAEADERMYPLYAPNDPPNDLLFDLQWHFHHPVGGIGAPRAWDIAQGEGVVVAVLDTGVLTDHPDLSANLLPGYDFISNAWISRRPTDARVAGALDLGDWSPVAGECYGGSPVRNSTWHGSHVAGTIAEVTHNGLGGAGVAYRAKVLPVRVLGRCGGLTSDIADAIVWASGGRVPGVPANPHPAEVINLSLGGNRSCPRITQDAIDIATANGSVVVVAAGNSNVDAADVSPASCRGVITVGASRITGGKAYYSNFGAAVDIAAPGGGGVEDTGNSGWDGYVLQAGSSSKTDPASGEFGYFGKIGTSMATPHVSAVAALVQGARAQAGRVPLTPSEMESLLLRTARPFPARIPATTPIGVGLLDARAALDEALKPACVDCGPQASPVRNRVPVTGMNGGAGSQWLYRFEAAPGRLISIMSYGGQGDVSVYAGFDRVPTASAHQYGSRRPGTVETIRIAPAEARAGTYYVLVVGETPFSGVNLQVRQ